MYRIGIGAVLVMILLPLFILAVIAKFFIDRSRAAQRHGGAEAQGSRLPPHERSR